MRCACCGSSLWRPNAWRSPAASWMISAGTSGSPSPPCSLSLGEAPTSVLPPPHLGSDLLLILGSSFLFPGSTMRPSLGSPSVLGLGTEPGPQVALPVPGPLFSPWPSHSPFPDTALRPLPQLSCIPGSRFAPLSPALSPFPGPLRPRPLVFPIPGSGPGPLFSLVLCSPSFLPLSLVSYAHSVP